MWTQFWDMHSGGGRKLEWEKIYIEAPEAEAKAIFYNRFGRNPERVTCTCCGEDYSISESETLALASAFHRNCRAAEGPKRGEWKYMEKGEPLPEGWAWSRMTETSARYDPNWDEYMTVEAYMTQPDVHIIPAAEIKPEERTGEPPAQGYVWVG